ncbi:MFS substrate transporter [Salix suchowensis]|nr:MFS substrate transporter [Salix suchowensis]
MPEAGSRKQCRGSLIGVAIDLRMPYRIFGEVQNERPLQQSWSLLTIVARRAAMNVPSSLAMIRVAYQDPVELNHAYAWYASAGAIGNVLGFVIGGVLTARRRGAGVRWFLPYMTSDYCLPPNPRTSVHYLIAIAVIPTSIVSWFILPNPVPKTDRRRGIDLPGVLTLTAGLILFVYAISDSADSGRPSSIEPSPSLLICPEHLGWGSPQVIATLVLSVVIMGVFFVVERIVKEPALPLQTWTNKNFIPLFFYGWTAYWWLLGMELQLVDVFTVRFFHHSSS